MRHRYLFALALLALAAQGAYAPRSEAAAPNVVIILADDKDESK